MKQGSAPTRMSGRKVEPVVKHVSVASVSQMGSMMGNKATDHKQILHGVSRPLYPGKASFGPPPMNHITTHKGGSQGSR